MKQQFLCQDLPAMAQCANTLAKHLSVPAVVFLQGPLGAGKTTLVQYLLKALGYSGSVTSPTFALLHEYQTSMAMIAHVDLYRIKHEEELEGIGLRDYLDSNTICLIEWPAKGGSSLPTPDWLIDIKMAPLGREITICNQACKMELAE